MTLDDVIHRQRVRVFALARELGNVAEACRIMGVHRSTYYRWRRQVLAWGLEALRPRERRPPRMPNQLPVHIETRILAFSLAHPGLGPKRISAELSRERWGGIEVSPNGIWRCLRRHGLGDRRRRLALVAGYAAPPEPERLPEPERHLEAPRPGALVGMDCFYVGRLSGTKGVVWQYTAIDCTRGFAGRSCTPRRRTPGNRTARRWPGGWPPSSRPPGGRWGRSRRITAASSETVRSPRT